MSRINGFSIPPPIPPISPNSASATGSVGGGEFKNFLLESLEQVNSMQADADQAVEQMMVGENVNPAEVLTAVQKADLTFRLMMQVRNKLVAAYQEIKDVRI